ncbi:uncharacterized protein B0I36DRAFT_344162 [Microdochium trichocladiopsis]|uniref:Uncharacterized protein n=1 Tax=Microdochium trichocladiopsis TaxID=1682393 RepID=A0A9P8YEQ1_9PEZI|nr:uncharacterized protein B0I36DRAFT_344162 [Microdochium trichocladiopsis]KAH7040412.1 hypothetical protein B0I36DRAFT_344162 [Microdochium trichocladiopsis]
MDNGLPLENFSGPGAHSNEAVMSTGSPAFHDPTMEVPGESVRAATHRDSSPTGASSSYCENHRGDAVGCKAGRTSSRSRGGRGHLPIINQLRKCAGRGEAELLPEFVPEAIAGTRGALREPNRKGRSWLEEARWGATFREASEEHDAGRKQGSAHHSAGNAPPQPGCSAKAPPAGYFN